MAMTPKIYSLNALATELDRDRRTIAAALRGVKPDGKSGRFDGWLLATALRHIDRRRLVDEHKPKSKVGQHFFGRLMEWEEILEQREGPLTRPIEQLEELIGASRQQVLSWLRAGMPYTGEGDWQTGDGFCFITAHVIDWHLLMSAGLHAHGDEATAKRLRLIGSDA